MGNNEYISKFLNDAKIIIDAIDQEQVAQMITILSDVRDKNGRLFVLGVGGGAGHASHCVNDFRKIAGIESYAPTDNVSELTARVNDDGWDTVFKSWLVTSHLHSDDCIFVFSVGGGSVSKNISVNLVNALIYAKRVGSKIIGVVGRDGGYTAQVADACVIISTVDTNTITPQTEAFQAVIWHLIVSSPAMQRYEMKWESSV
jgi:D-sedoheptulose 7-phosphate isomerase